jgi:drug/metabolite transporter (DMT)-like permease
MTLAIAAVLIFGVQDALTKVTVQSISPFQLSMMRFWSFAAFSLFLVARQAPLSQAFRSRYPLLQVVRAVLLVVDIWCFAASLITVPLAEVQAIVLVYPLLATVMAIPILGEKVGPFRFVMVAIGFFGALVIVRPGGLPFSWGVVYALGSAACYAAYLALTRKVSSHDSTATSMVYVGVVGLVLTSAVGVFFWQPLGGIELLIVAGVMVLSIASHGLMMMALSRAPASVLQPFNYLGLPWGIALSYVIFGHLIEPGALAGGAIIVVAGLIVMAREQILARAGRHHPPEAAEESPQH